MACLFIFYFAFFLKGVSNKRNYIRFLTFTLWTIYTITVQSDLQFYLYISSRYYPNCFDVRFISDFIWTTHIFSFSQLSKMIFLLYLYCSYWCYNSIYSCPITFYIHIYFFCFILSISTNIIIKNCHDVVYAKIFGR